MRASVVTTCSKRNNLLVKRKYDQIRTFESLPCFPFQVLRGTRRAIRDRVPDSLAHGLQCGCVHQFIGRPDWAFSKELTASFSSFEGAAEKAARDVSPTLASLVVEAVANA